MTQERFSLGAAILFLSLALAGAIVGCSLDITNDNDNDNRNNNGGGSTGPTGAPATLSCVASACSAGGCSAITCTWDGPAGTLCATSSLGRFCLPGRSPIEIDPGPPGLGGADWLMTLDVDGATVSGGVVRTDT